MSGRTEFDQFDAETSRSLRGVRMLAHSDLPNWPAVIELMFDEFTVFLCAEPDYDTLLCTRELPDSYRKGYVVVLSAAFWDPVIGWNLAWAWQMRNDRGYVDALHLQFSQQPGAGPHRHIQLWVVGSAIRMMEFQVVRECPDPGTPAGPEDTI
jgi:hypothetical protein